MKDFVTCLTRRKNKADFERRKSRFLLKNKNLTVNSPYLPTVTIFVAIISE